MFLCLGYKMPQNILPQITCPNVSHPLMEQAASDIFTVRLLPMGLFPGLWKEGLKCWWWVDQKTSEILCP